MRFAHAILIACAIAFGLSDIASAIRHAKITLNFGNAMVVTTEPEPPRERM